MELIKVVEFEYILGQIEVISKEQNEIAHQLLIVEYRLFKHIKNDLIRGKVDFRRFNREALHNIKSKLMERADFCRNFESFVYSVNELPNSFLSIGNHHDFLGIYMLFLNEILNLCRHRCGLACTCTGNQKAIIIIGHNGSSLLIVKTNLRIDFSKNVVEIFLLANKSSFDIFLIMGNNALIQRMHLSQKAF